MTHLVLLLLLTLFQLPTPPKHITLALTSSATTAAPGSKVSLYLDIIPNPGIHVYAPSAKGYLAITLKAEAPRGVTLAAMKYPKSETLEFDGQNVPVYAKPFRLTQPMAIQKSVKEPSVTVAGTLHYQACDDKVCFLPATVPVRWTIAIAVPSSANQPNQKR